MKPRRTPEPPRAKKGSVETSKLVGMSSELAAAAAASAKALGISQAEWWRQAAASYLAQLKRR